MYFSGSRGLGVLPYGIEPPLTVGRYGTYPSIDLAISEYERRRKAVEDWVTKVQREQNRYLTQDEWRPLLPVPYGTYIHDPSGSWWRAGDITTVAWEIMPPVIAAGPPGTWQPSAPMSEVEAAAWIAKVEASRQPLYGSPLTIPSRMGWTMDPAELKAWADSLRVNLGWANEKVLEFFASFASHDEFAAWWNEASVNPAMWQQKSDELWGQPAPYVPPSAAPPPPEPLPIPEPPPAAPGSPAGGGNVAPPGSTPPGHRYPILPYAPNAGTAALRAHGWPADVIGFWLANAFGGDMALTEAFLLSFSGREELGAWMTGKTPADIYARADAALAARTTTTTTPPGYVPPEGETAGGISIPLLALAGAAAIYFFRR